MIHVDYKDRRPIYEQVIDRLQDSMIRGILKEGDQLPSVRSLATDLAINPNTIQRAYSELERKGYIYSVKGKGSFVAENKKIQELVEDDLLKQLEELTGLAKGLKMKKETIFQMIEQIYGNPT